jgi:FkbM family methyltransferase
MGRVAACDDRAFVGIFCPRRCEAGRPRETDDGGDRLNATSLCTAPLSPTRGGRQPRNLIAEIESHQALRGGAHRAGTLTTAPLRAIEAYLTTHFGDRQIQTVETGCGASTILLAHYAHNHLAFCYDDRAERNSSVDFATSFPGFDADCIEWVFGPTQQTILSRPLREPVDLVLIDGPHGYPFPELEYFAFYPWLRPEGVLILDDIHIPTIRNLYEFLREDAMFYPHQVVGTTAFLIRTQVPALSREGDDWWLQRYNIQRFPAVATGTAGAKLGVPFGLSYGDGRLARLGDAFHRGFILVDGQPTTEGDLAMLRLELDRPVCGATVVDIEVECVAAEQQPEAGFEAFVNLTSLGKQQFRGEQRIRLSVTIDDWTHPVIDIKFHLWGQRAADEIVGFPSGTFDKRRPGLILKRIAARPAHAPGAGPAAAATAAAAGDIVTREGAIVSFRCQQQTVRFFVDNPEDAIQAEHAAGRFYEWDTLGVLRRHVERGAGVLDVGAKGGNHTVFFERILGASRVVPIEVDPGDIERLRLNTALNQLTRTDLGHLGIALGARPGRGTAVGAGAASPHSSMLIEDPAGIIPILPGDGALEGHEFGLIRIAAQCNALDVLQGLSRTIQRNRPVVVLSVSDKTRQNVQALLHRWGYGIAGEQMRSGTIVSLVFKHQVS